MLDTAPAKTFYHHARPRQAHLRWQTDFTYNIGMVSIHAQVGIIWQRLTLQQRLEKRHELRMPEATHTSILEALWNIGQWGRHRWGQRPYSSAAQSGSRHKIRASSVGRT